MLPQEADELIVVKGNVLELRVEERRESDLAARGHASPGRRGRTRLRARARSRSSPPESAPRRRRRPPGLRAAPRARRRARAPRESRVSSTPRKAARRGGRRSPSGCAGCVRALGSAPTGRRLVEYAQMIEPRAQQGKRLPRGPGRVLRRRGLESERRRELGDVQDRRGHPAGNERRHDRPAGLLPAAGPSAAVVDVQRLVVDPAFAKELPGRSAGRSGPLPEQRDALHSEMIAPVKIAVVGTGAMGSVYAGLLGSAGNEVWAIDRWRAHVDAIGAHGLRVEGASGDRVVRLRATTDPGEAGEVELVVIATKAFDVGCGRRVRAPSRRTRNARSLDSERPRRPRHRGLDPRRGAGRRRRRRRFRRFDRRARPRPPPRPRAAPARRAPGAGNAEDRGDCAGLARGGLQRSNLRRRRPARLGEADLQRLLRRPRSPARHDDRRGDRRPHAWTVASCCAREAFDVARTSGVTLGFDDAASYVRDYGLRRSPAHARRCCSTCSAGGRPRSTSSTERSRESVAKLGVATPFNEAVTALVKAREAAALQRSP